MSSLLLDDTGDLDITDSQLSLTSGLQAIQQHLQVKLRIFLGEWFLNTDVGVPYYRDVLIKSPNFVQVSATLKTEILETTGVLELSSFEFDYDNEIRAFTLDFKTLTEEGVIDFSQEIEV